MFDSMFELLIMELGFLVFAFSFATWKVYEYGLLVYRSLPAHIHSDSEHVFNLRWYFLLSQ